MKTVLVIDDSQAVRQQVSLALTQGGFKVVEAGDGPSGLRQLEAAPVDAVISDINMPGMNGLELMETISRNPKWGRLPVVMLTSEAQPHLIERAKKAGARGWIIKPFKPDLLIAAIQKLVA